MIRQFRGLCVGIIIPLIIFGCLGCGSGIQGDMKVWHPITLTFKGPQASEADAINPFLDYRMTVTFRSGDKSYTVPGYFAADGKAAKSGATKGNKWRVHFTPDQPGEWTYLVTFRKGELVVLSDDPQAGKPVSPDSTTGTFVVQKNDKTDPGFYAKGRLVKGPGHYLQFAGTGEPFLKTGADSPENFLAYADFDQTPPTHKYAPHVKDWNKGDPVWRKDRGKAIIGALNYLASQKMNSVYFLTMNVFGDGNDVWPWTKSYERLRYDCSKLDQWEIVFSHMDRLGILLHVVTQETENELLLDNGNTDVERKLYYRELVARFGHHLGIVWNLGEENGYAPFTQNAQNDNQRRAMAAYMEKIDPYDHLIVLHTHAEKTWRDPILKPLLDNPDIGGVALQVANMQNGHTVTHNWIAASGKTKNPWVCCLDEIGPYDVGVAPDAVDPTHDDVRKFALWGNLMAGGGGCEWYFGDSDQSCEDWRTREAMWQQSRIAAQFFRENISFSEMKSMDELVADRNAWCFAKEGFVYAVYLLNGGTTRLNLKMDRSIYRIQWYNPRTGGALSVGTVYEVAGPGWVSIGVPPTDRDKDWVALVKAGR